MSKEVAAPAARLIFRKERLLSSINTLLTTFLKSRLFLVFIGQQIFSPIKGYAESQKINVDPRLF
jgi:hypothetical protein